MRCESCVCLQDVRVPRHADASAEALHPQLDRGVRDRVRLQDEEADCVERLERADRLLPRRRGPLGKNQNTN